MKLFACLASSVTEPPNGTYIYLPFRGPDHGSSNTSIILPAASAKKQTTHPQQHLSPLVLITIPSHFHPSMHFLMLQNSGFMSERDITQRRVEFFFPCAMK